MLAKLERRLNRNLIDTKYTASSSSPPGHFSGWIANAVPKSPMTTKKIKNRRSGTPSPNRVRLVMIPAPSQSANQYLPKLAMASQARLNSRSRHCHLSLRLRVFLSIPVSSLVLLPLITGSILRIRCSAVGTAVRAGPSWNDPDLLSIGSTSWASHSCHLFICQLKNPI